VHYEDAEKVKLDRTKVSKLYRSAYKFTLLAGSGFCQLTFTKFRYEAIKAQEIYGGESCTQYACKISILRSNKRLVTMVRITF
jgi:hypothetical protein